MLMMLAISQHSDWKFYLAICGLWFHWQFSFQSFAMLCVSALHMHPLCASLGTGYCFISQFSSQNLCCASFSLFCRSGQVQAWFASGLTYNLGVLFSRPLSSGISPMFSGKGPLLSVTFTRKDGSTRLYHDNHVYFFFVLPSTLGIKHISYWPLLNSTC